MGRSSYHPDLPCQPYVSVQLGYHPWKGRKKAWHLDCQLEQADFKHSMWTFTRMYETHEEAARMAADFALEAIGLLCRSLQTASKHETPGDRMATAAEAHIDETIKPLQNRLNELTRLRSECDPEDDTKIDVLRRTAAAVCVERDRAYREAEYAFYRSHDWRDWQQAS